MTTASTQLAWIDRGVRAVIRHWLVFVNSMAILYAALPWIGPLLERAGYTRLGRLVFLLYTPLCHQLPERSFFISRYQVCYCHRCTALYSTIALTGLLYGALRWRFQIPNRVLGWAAIPILVDGLWHLADDYLPWIGLRGGVDGVGSLNFWVRMVTGLVFGVVAVLWLYPRIQETFAEV
jgi:uncharacterized membrane protein